MTDAACLANMGVPGYADHSYNIVNFYGYIPDKNDWLADATAVWDNPGAYMSASFKQTLTGISNPSTSQLRAAIKRMLFLSPFLVLNATQSGSNEPNFKQKILKTRESNYYCLYLAVYHIQWAHIQKHH